MPASVPDAQSSPPATARRRALARSFLLAGSIVVAAPLVLLASPPAALAQQAPGRSAPAAGQPPTIAAASDLKFVLEELAGRFTAETGRKLRLSFGSSGNFARQIEQGAPYALFLSADEEMVFRLADKGLTVDRGELYAVGRIVLIAPHGSPLKVDGELRDLAAALADGRLRRFAIANPEHAPYGRRAEEALRHAGLWDAIRPKLVLGENVSQAAQFATSGNAQGGIVAYSLALSPPVAKLGSHALIPEDWHRPLRQRMVLLKGADETARLFYDWLRQPTARELMRRYGFGLPGEGSEGGKAKAEDAAAANRSPAGQAGGAAPREGSWTGRR